MKAVILAGGYGTRISEESTIRPKPMVEIGGMPMLWHIMQLYSAHGIDEFIICCGYKGHLIKEYFANYFLHRSDVTFDLRSNSMEVHQHTAEAWRVTLVDTGETTMTGGRLKRVQRHLNNETFCFTYGDGVSNLDLEEMRKLVALAGGKACATNQVLYNLSRRGIEFDLLPWSQEHRIPVMAYSPIEQAASSAARPCRSWRTGSARRPRKWRSPGCCGRRTSSRSRRRRAQRTCARTTRRSRSSWTRRRSPRWTRPSRRLRERSRWR